MTSQIDHMSHAINVLARVERCLVDLRRHDVPTYEHSLRVAARAKMLAELKGLTTSETWIAYAAGGAHDLGKLFLPPKWLRQQRPLSPVQRLEFRNHVLYGVQILRTMPDLAELLIPGVLHHHEDQCGTGYPQGLRAGEISLHGSLIRIADSWDAMTTRLYSPAKSIMEVRAEFARGAGTEFDSDIVALLLTLLDGEATTSTHGRHGVNGVAHRIIGGAAI